MPQTDISHENEVIDLSKIFSTIWRKKALYLKVLPTVFVLSCVYIFSIPRDYTSETKVAPEMEGSNIGGSLSSIAASLGFDMADMQSSDAITPLIYPELMSDNGFVSGLFGIHVRSTDGKIDTDYYTYMRKYQKTAWWNYPLGWLSRLIAPKPAESKGDGKFDPYNLSRTDDDVVQGIQGNISISVDKKMGVISISTMAQDPLICKTIADSTREHLLEFITEYRTKKARKDYEYYKQLTAEAKAEYDRARQRYGSRADANMNAMLTSVKSQVASLENETQMRYSAYNLLSTQMQTAKAKVQERTPAFTLVKGASVPLKPAKPKRVIFVLFMLFLAFAGTTAYVLYRAPKSAA